MIMLVNLVFFLKKGFLNLLNIKTTIREDKLILTW